MKSTFGAAAGGLILLALGACGDGSSVTTDTNGASPNSPPGETDSGTTDAAGGEPETDASTTDAGGATSSGCGLANAPTGLQSKTTKLGAASRRYQLFVPPSYDPSRPTRLIFVFHGLGGTSEQIRGYFGFEAESGGQAIFVYPDGVVRFQGRTAWAAEDLPFFDTMVSEVSASYCVDRKRIFAAGHSFGGYMSNLVGCARGDVVRAIAPVSGGFVAADACKGPVAVWLAHGADDSVVPPSEGLTARDRWLSTNTCGATSKPTTPSPCVTYDGCSADHPVTWCSFSGGHFPLPSFIKKGIWDFFAAK